MKAVVGLFALGAGIFGVTALGMGIMAGIVAVGVAKGELDPSPQVCLLLYFDRSSSAPRPNAPRRGLVRWGEDPCRLWCFLLLFSSRRRRG